MNTNELMNINELVANLLNKKSDTPFVIKVREGLGVKMRSFKRKRRWHLDTDLFGYSHFDYSEKGQEELKHLATQSQLSDGAQIESQTKRVFAVSFNPDTKEGIRYTYGLWLEVIKRILMKDIFIIDISSQNNK